MQETIAARSFVLGRYALALGLALLAGCSGAPSTASLPARADDAQRIAHRTSGSPSSLLYVVTSNSTVMLSYPGYESVGSLNPQGFLGFPCSGGPNGNVFLDDGSDVRQYAYGGTNPISIIALSGNDSSTGCSVNPTNGDLALAGVHMTEGTIFIYPGGTGRARSYGDKRIVQFYYCGYDSNGNLFADGLDKHRALTFVELPKGASGFTEIALNGVIKSPGNVQFDGTYITIRSGTTLFRLKIEGSSSKIASKTNLDQLWASAPSTWIQGGAVVGSQGGGNHPGHGLGFWNYPAGGKPFMVITTLSGSKKDLIMGTTISVAPSD